MENSSKWNTCTYETPIGSVLLSSDGSFLTSLRYLVPAGFTVTNVADAVTDHAARQLDEYFAGKREVFDVPIRPIGTDFQRLVWDMLLTIPYGQTRSYKQVAQMAGNANASRAVGLANNRNPISIIIPCHRVVGSNGALVGYAGGLGVKQGLLDLENGSLLLGL